MKRIEGAAKRIRQIQEHTKGAKPVAGDDFAGVSEADIQKATAQAVHLALLDHVWDAVSGTDARPMLGWQYATCVAANPQAAAMLEGEPKIREALKGLAANEEGPLTREKLLGGVLKALPLLPKKRTCEWRENTSRGGGRQINCELAMRRSSSNGM